jgi:hypothetical protein
VISCQSLTDGHLESALRNLTFEFHMQWAEFTLKRTITDACHEEEVKEFKVKSRSSSHIQISQILHVLNCAFTH